MNLISSFVSGLNFRLFLLLILCSAKVLHSNAEVNDVELPGFFRQAPLCGHLEYKMRFLQAGQKDTLECKVTLFYQKFNNIPDSFMFLMSINNDNIYIYNFKSYYKFFPSRKEGFRFTKNWNKFDFDIFKEGSWIGRTSDAICLPLLSPKTFLKSLQTGKEGSVNSTKSSTLTTLTFKNSTTTYKAEFSNTDTSIRRFTVSDAKHYCDYNFEKFSAYDSIKLFNDSLRDTINNLKLQFPIMNEPSVSLLKTGEAAPDWRLKDVLTGKTINLYSLKDKIVLLDFWYINCGHCQRAMPELKRLYSNYKDSNLIIIGINLIDRKEKIIDFLVLGKGMIPFGIDRNDTVGVKEYIKKNRIAYLIVMGSPDLDKLYKLDNSYPTFYLLGKDKRIIRAQRGYNITGMSDFEVDIKREIHH